MKKIIGLLLAVALVFQGSLFTAFADDGTINNLAIEINSSLSWDGDTPKFDIEFKPDIQGVDVISVKYTDKNNNEATISGSNISVADGQYSYELTLRAGEGLVFNNELNGFTYQGVDGNYNMTYSIPAGGDNHTMIVSGSFNNIISASPLKIDAGKLLKMVLDKDYSGAIDFILNDSDNFSENVSIESGNTHVSNDTYSYELVLKTKEGFHFSNSLEFLYDEDKYGYTMDYDYSLADNNHTLKITGNVEKKQTETPPPVVTPKPVNPTLAADKAITSMTKDSDPKGSVFARLKLRSTVQTGSTIRLNWEKLGNARWYAIYGNRCGNGIKPVRLSLVRGNTFAVSKIKNSTLKKGTYYKFIVVAIDKNGKIISKSKMICVTPKGGKTCNYKSVTVKKSVINKAKKLRRGKTLYLKAKAVKQSKKLKVKKYAGLRYESTNKKVATVNSKGKITAKAKGTCYVYAYAQNGVFKQIKVNVK